jgi:mannitol/fructose-specific phosphotransferase system IIA component (Ntr-type)
MMLTDFLHEEQILLNLEAANYRGALLTMLERSSEKDIGPLVERILEREKLMPTAIGKGIFLPRVIQKEKQKTEVIMAINHKGLIFDDYGTAIANIILLFVFSEKDDYAAILAQSLRLLTDDVLRVDLLNSKRPRDVIKAVREWEKE